MENLDRQIFEADLASAPFRAGVSRGIWGIAAADAVPANITFPRAIFWLGAAPRTGAPDRFYVTLDCAGYRGVSPTGTFWDPERKEILAVERRPKGAPGSRFAKVFRTDWESGSAFYHPYDRHGARTHPQWATEQPHLVWTPEHTIVDFLTEFHELLHSGEYVGI
jgi:hypothetical protein